MYLKALVVGDVLEASNGNKYKTVSFQELSQFVKLPSGTREVKSNAKPAKRTLWAGQDGLFDNFEVDDITFGEIRRIKVASYVIGEGTADERTVDTFTGVAFKGETDEMMAKKYGHTLPAGEPVSEEEARINAEIIKAEAEVVVGAEIPV
jgi:hypothetical protein